MDKDDKVANEEKSATGDHHGVEKVNGIPDQKDGTTGPSIILVTGLSDEISGRDLKKFLRQFGKVGKIKLMMIKTSVANTGEMVNRRFAHVTVSSVNSAHQLVEKMNQVDCNLKGSHLQVTRAPESGPMSANYGDSSVPVPNKNGQYDKSVKPADPSSSNDNLDGETDRGLLYSDQSSHNTPSPTRTITIGVTRNQIQPISDGEITDVCTDDVVSSSNQRQDNRNDQRKQHSNSDLSGDRRRKGNYPEEGRCYRDRPRDRRTCSSLRSVTSHRREASCGMESPRKRKKRLREESVSPPRRAGPGRNSMAGSDDRGRRGRSVAMTRKERVTRSPCQQSRGGILTYDQIKEAQRQRDRERMRYKPDGDGNCDRSQDRGNSFGNKRCSSTENRASRELQRLERAQKKLQEEREKIELEKLELIHLQREQQRKEMEEIEREKERVRRAKQRLLKEQLWKTKTTRFGNTIAEQVIGDMHEKERSQEEFTPPSFAKGRSRSKSISRPRPSSLSRRRSPERMEGRYSHKPNFNWEEDDDDYSPRNTKPRRGYSSVKSPEILVKGLAGGDGSLHRNRDHMHLASASSSSHSLGYSSSHSQSGSGRKDSGKDAVEEFLGKIGARAMTHGSDHWKFGGGSGAGAGATSVRATVGTSVSSTVSVIRPSSQTDTFIDLLGNPYTISALSERGPGFPRGGRLSDAIASVYNNQNGTSTSANDTPRSRSEGGGGGRGGGRGGLFIHANRYKTDFQRYYQQS